ncbi:MAG: hypothetical protein AAB542_04095 [Patescibacteria group bacterium]
MVRTQMVSVALRLPEAKMDAATVVAMDISRLITTMMHPFNIENSA